MEPAVAAPVIDAPAPDTSLIPDGTPAPDASSASPPIAPETPAPTVPETAPKAPDNVVIYQDVVAKYNEDNSYKMTDKESEIFLEIQGQINGGKM